MAMLNMDGLDELALSLEELADIPAEVLQDMLEAEGEVVRTAQKQTLRGKGIVDTGQLAESISMSRKLKRDRSGVPGLSVYPAGVRRDGKTMNAEVGFIKEYGAPGRGMEATQWMRTANEACAEEAVGAAAKVYSDWLNGKGL